MFCSKNDVTLNITIWNEVVNLGWLEKLHRLWNRFNFNAGDARLFEWNGVAGVVAGTGGAATGAKEAPIAIGVAPHRRR